MRYQVLPALWEKLADEERSLRWLGRKAQVDPSHLSLVQTGNRQTVNSGYAERISAVFGLPVNAFFSPACASQLAESDSDTDDQAAD
jgi:hypothetical protein